MTAGGGGLVASGALARSGGPTPARVLVYDHVGTLAADVRDAVEHHDPVPEIVDCRRPRALADFLTEQRFDVLVAGPGLDSRAGFERLRIIREELPSMPIVLAVANTAELDVRDVVRAGAVDLVEIPIPGEKLRETMDRALQLARRTAEVAGPGTAIEPVRPDSSIPKRVITIASASGGCGKTFLATNLAWFLTHHAKRRVCIIDLDLQFGEVSASLRLRPRYTITDLIQHDNDDEAEFNAHFEEFCETHETGISVLAAPRDPTEAAAIRPADVGRVIDAARAHFDDVIVDTPPALADSVVVAYNRSDELFVMATLDIPSIRNMQVFLSTLERLHVSNDGIRLILNKAESDAGVEIRQVLKLFPQGFDATLPYAREVQRSINAGRPVLATNPSADISRQISNSMKRLLPADAQDRFTEYEAANRPGRFRMRNRKPKAVTA
ncbi:AAA family ATPase [Aquihabitans sp. G128]|uniref:response regulator n=1 Tax=Aquihabitans sp. G128 TaxID=2849779 RepID=UPI001C24892B|nr:AAA family ATPase [Aquihabitans sp. G128]QXC61365.1 AAA family ATPase [Aquihabitans sp. G128]